MTAVVVVTAGLLRALPDNRSLYARLHGVDADRLHLAEDRTCANALRSYPDGQEELTVNASPQNNYPFDEFHLVLGLTPALLQAQPRRVMALGLGIGATPYGVSLDPRVEHLTTVEICGPEVTLLRDLGARRSSELRRFFADPRVTVQVGDGRDFLLRTGERFDVVVVDTLRPQAAFSGNLYSREFYRLVADRLADTGMLAQWVPSVRTLNTVLEVFPWVVQFGTRYHDSTFLVASRRPITFDRSAVLARLAGVPADAGLSPESRAAVEGFFATAEPRCALGPGDAAPVDDPGQVNGDLHPRDEYFLNQPPTVEPRADCQWPAPALPAGRGQG